jgi:hypothetical protein
MDKAVIVWLVVFAAAALIFFGVAVVVTIKGFGDLMALLRHADVRGERAQAANDAADGPDG